MSGSDVYLILLADRARLLFAVLLVVSIVAAAVSAMSRHDNLDYSHPNVTRIQFWEKWLRISLITIAVSSMLLAFVPSTKDIMLIKVIPILTSEQTLQYSKDLVEEALSILREYFKPELPRKKGG